MRLFSKVLNNNRVTRFLKNYRNSLVNYFFVRKPPACKLNCENLESDSNSGIVFCIAFNHLVCIEIMIDAWTRFAEDTILVVVDNSSDPIVRKQIQSFCKGRKVAYVALPKNPEWNPNRSHALAMNWTYCNLVLKWKPKLFGYLDHDCFPFAKFDLQNEMSDFLLFGEKRVSEKNSEFWNLWAGFCFFRFSFVQNKAINFTHNVELGLDTGGSNWNTIYKLMKANEVNYAKQKQTKLKIFNASTEKYSIIDSFIHIGSASRTDKGNSISHPKWKLLLSQLDEKIVDL